MIATSEGIIALLRSLEAASDLEANTFRKHALVRAPWQAAPSQDAIDIVLYVGQDPQDEAVLAAASESGFGSIKTITIDQALEAVRDQLSRFFAEKAIDRMANSRRLDNVAVETQADERVAPPTVGTQKTDKWAAFKDVLSLASGEAADETGTDS